MLRVQIPFEKSLAREWRDGWRKLLEVHFYMPEYKDDLAGFDVFPFAKPVTGICLAFCAGSSFRRFINRQ